MPKRIGEILPELLQRTKATQQAMDRLQRRWQRLAGEELARHARPIRLRRGTLYVHVDSPGASFALSLEKPRLLKQLNAGAAQPIKEIVVRAGEL